MKTAYELAMERLGKGAPSVKLSPEKKSELADLDSRYKAKLAEREIFLNSQLEEALGKGDPEAIEQIRKQLTSERRALQAELEEKKEQVRQRA